jgi:hypothetical protein
MEEFGCLTMAGEVSPKPFDAASATRLALERSSEALSSI